MGLSPLATAILLRSESQVKSILSSVPEVASDRTYGMTVLHLSAAWPMGLTILFSAGASKFIDATCHSTRRSTSIPITALDLAIHFSCADAVALLMGHGASWMYFIPQDALWLFAASTLYGPTSEIVDFVAKALAARRRALYDLAKTVLPTGDLPLSGIPDTESAELVQRITRTGQSVSPALFVPPLYEGIYLSGWVPAEQFPIFFEAGFQHTINSPNRIGLRPIMFAELITYPTNVPEPGRDGRQILSLATLSWLDDHSCLNQGPEDPLSLGLNKFACGWLYLATSFLRQLCASPPLTTNLVKNASLFLGK